MSEQPDTADPFADLDATLARIDASLARMRGERPTYLRLVETDDD